MLAVGEHVQNFKDHSSPLYKILHKILYVTWIRYLEMYWKLNRLAKGKRHLYLPPTLEALSVSLSELTYFIIVKTRGSIQIFWHNVGHTSIPLSYLATHIN